MAVMNVASTSLLFSSVLMLAFVYATTRLVS